MATVGTACASVSSCRRELCAALETMPCATMATASSMTALPSNRRRRKGRPVSGSGWDMDFSSAGLRRRLWAVAPVNNAEHDRDKEQCGNGGKDQAADHRTAERRILLAPLTQA